MAKDNKQEKVIEEEPGALEGKPSAKPAEATGKRLWLLGLTALGIVFGDIGTSPLYAVRFVFSGPGNLSPSPQNVLGILSLIFWSLTIIISLKYLIYVMRANNEGEGGILALMALLVPSGESGRRRGFQLALGVFGAALLYGDGMITPAISVLSAVEGLNEAAPFLDRYILTITTVILLLLFISQRHGTAAVGSAFGPVMLLWFTTLAALGIYRIVGSPGVLGAINPWHAASFFAVNRWTGVAVLGAVFLVVTGGEALYADMGHFGSRPIRLGWFLLVFPALLLNYFGQGALLLSRPQAAAQPFYNMGPAWTLYPLLILATAATIIASQAIISGAFSLTRQATLLGLFPRIRITQTSGTKSGQIYIALVDWVLMVATIGLVLGFRKSSNLAGAYGVAVSTTMVITTILAYSVARRLWGWTLLASVAVSAVFLSVDLSYFAVNLFFKLTQGGWFALLVGAAIFLLMMTWRRGRELIAGRTPTDYRSLDGFLHELAQCPPPRVPGMAVFMTGLSSGVPFILSHHLRHNRVLHEQVILLTVVVKDVPKVPADRRLEVTDLESGFRRVVISFGFMEGVDVPQALRSAPFDVDPDKITYYVGRQTILPGLAKGGMMRWRKKLFAFMARNAAPSTSFYNLPAEQVVELGAQLRL